MNENLDPRKLDRFASLLRESKNIRVGNAQLWQAFASAFPHRPSGPAERELFLAALQGLENRGEVRLPSARGRRWNRVVNPSVPLSVDLVRSQKIERSQDWRRFPWHPSLQWVLDLKSLPEEHSRLLQRVHRGLVNGRFQEPVPIKYRSLELTGEEKRLDALIRTSSLFAPGRLTLDLLNCFQETLPIAWESVGPADGMLIFENAGPFAVARRVLSKTDEAPYGMVGYGGGKGVLASLGHLRTIGRDISRISYVGDLDATGLAIAFAVRQRAAALGLPDVEPATDLHRGMIMSAAELGFPHGWPRNGPKPSMLPNDDAMSFLALDLRKHVRHMLRAGHRIPEEVLGPVEMREAFLSTRQTMSDPGSKR